MRPRILHIVGTASSAGSGIARLIRLTATRLASSFSFHVLFLSDEQGPLPGQLLGERIDVTRLEWTRGAREPRRMAQFAIDVRRLRPAVLHQHFGGRSIRWAAKIAGVRSVLTQVHSRGPEETLRERGPIRLPGATLAIAPCRSVQRLIRGVETVTVYNAVELRPLAARHGTEQMVVGAAARLASVKGIDVLLRAFAGVDQRWMLEVAGDGPERVALERMAASLGIEHRVRFLGFRTDLSDLMRTWSVFALPSRDEALPVALLEAMEAGLPIVASNVGGIREAVTHGVNGLLVPAEDATALGHALGRLVLDPLLRKSLGERSRETVEQRFSADRMAAEMERIYARFTA